MILQNRKIGLNQQIKSNEDNPSDVSKLYCPACRKNGKSSVYRLYKINTVESVSLCEEKSCLYPVGNYESYVYTQKSSESSQVDYENAQSLYTMAAMFIIGESSCSDNFAVLEYITTMLKSVQECIEILKLKGTEIVEKAETLYNEMVANRGNFNWLSINCMQNEKTIDLSKYELNTRNFRSIVSCNYSFNDNTSIDDYSLCVLKNRISLNSNDFSTVILHLLETYNLAELKYTAYLSSYHEVTFKKYEYLIRSFPNLYKIQENKLSLTQTDPLPENGKIEISRNTEFITKNETARNCSEDSRVFNTNISNARFNQQILNMDQNNAICSAESGNEENILDSDSEFDFDDLTFHERERQKVSNNPIDCGPSLESSLTYNENSHDCMETLNEFNKNDCKRKEDNSNNCCIDIPNKILMDCNQADNLEQDNPVQQTKSRSSINDSQNIWQNMPMLSELPNLSDDFDMGLKNSQTDRNNKEQYNLNNEVELKSNKLKPHINKLNNIDKLRGLPEVCNEQDNHSKEKQNLTTKIVRGGSACQRTSEKVIQTQHSTLSTNNSSAPITMTINSKTGLNENVESSSNLFTDVDTDKSSNFVTGFKSPIQTVNPLRKNIITPGKHISEDNKSPVYRIRITSESDDKSDIDITKSFTKAVDNSNTKKNSDNERDIKDAVIDESIEKNHDVEDVKIVDYKPISNNLIEGPVTGKITTSFGEVSWNVDLTGINIKQDDNFSKLLKQESLSNATELKNTSKKSVTNIKRTKLFKRKKTEVKQNIGNTKYQLVMKPVKVSIPATVPDPNQSRKSAINKSKNIKPRNKKKIAFDYSSEDDDSVKASSIPQPTIEENMKNVKQKTDNQTATCVEDKGPEQVISKSGKIMKDFDNPTAPKGKQSSGTLDLILQDLEDKKGNNDSTDKDQISAEVVPNSKKKAKRKKDVNKTALLGLQLDKILQKIEVDLVTSEEEESEKLSCVENSKSQEVNENNNDCMETLNEFNKNDTKRKEENSDNCCNDIPNKILMNWNQTDNLEQDNSLQVQLTKSRSLINDSEKIWQNMPMLSELPNLSDDFDMGIKNSQTDCNNKEQHNLNNKVEIKSTSTTSIDELLKNTETNQQKNDSFDVDTWLSGFLE